MPPAILIKISLDNGMLPHNTKPLLGPILTYHRLDPASPINASFSGSHPNHCMFISLLLMHVSRIIVSVMKMSCVILEKINYYSVTFHSAFCMIPDARHSKIIWKLHFSNGSYIFHGKYHCHLNHIISILFLYESVILDQMGNTLINLTLQLNTVIDCRCNFSTCSNFLNWNTLRSELILGMDSANERRRYNVTSSLIGWAHTQNEPWRSITTCYPSRIKLLIYATWNWSHYQTISSAKYSESQNNINRYPS